MEENEKNWLKEKIIFSSVTLIRLRDSEPVDFGSGCIVLYCNYRLLLTVFHVVEHCNDWYLQGKVDWENNRSLLYPIGEMNYLKRLNLNPYQIENVDFVYSFIPDNVKPFWYGGDGKREIVEVENIISDINFDIEMSLQKKYRFWGIIGRSYDKKHPYFQSRIERGRELFMTLRYAKKDKDLYVFEVEESNFGEKHPGDPFIKGCSGSPIMDDDGNIVSLVCSGKKQQNYIFGLALKDYKVCLDILCGIIK